MGARRLDGNQIRDAIKAELAQEISDLKAAGITPGLAAVLVGENPASQIYVRNKVKACQELGLYSEKIEWSASTSTEQLLDLISSLNARDEIDGILVQLPLPPQVDAKRVLLAIDPAKDIDGLHPVNMGNLVSGRPGLVPCTPAGIIEILERSRIPIEGARAVVVGRSDLVGKPVAMLLLHRHATVTICHSKTRDLPAVAREADILVAAMGKPAYVTAEFIKPGATVIDVGTNRLTTPDEVRRVFHDPGEALKALETKGSVLVGDVQPEDVREKAGAYTPVPGGVGPLTIAMLMANTVKAARLRRGARAARFSYPSGEEIKPGDQIKYHGESGEVEFVVSGFQGDPARDWYLKEFPGGGIMIRANGLGNVFLTQTREDEDLEFVSRAG
ncbi:MAG TPA: bifunctional methylenetetrahydrofolate dehydrogenase/methenyltetrahydrofolate cyclohydrolase FolD [Terriglobia bacterium]|nr:bifunctional methylenetetrahydrofolate dehydrogenase/methenyltetrahydrofolate cyclohydrolase FolD [Terriglobia bacterium]